MKKLGILLLVCSLLAGCSASVEAPETLPASETTSPVVAETTEVTVPEITEAKIVLKESHGTMVYAYANTTIPEGLGQPQLTDEKIDALIREQDYAKTAAAINTLADAINYYHRARMEFDDRRNNNMQEGYSYKQSAWQVLKNNCGQCVTMSNLNHYLLQDDYDEVGYVSVKSPGDGHVMTYILENGVYYLINSVDYTVGPKLGWLDSFPDVLGCAEDFQDIADSLLENMRLGDDVELNMIHLVNAPGDFINGKENNLMVYPEGYQVTVYCGIGYTFGKTTMDWQTQTRIDE